MIPKYAQLQNQLASLIGQHAAWLDGPTWMNLMDHIGHAYFDDMPSLVDAEAFAEAFAEELAKGPADLAIPNGKA